MSGKIWIVIGSLSLAIAVGLGALGAHGLVGWLDGHFPNDAVKRLANWKTAAMYQMFHSLGLVLIGVIAIQKPAGPVGKWLTISAVVMILGILIFSGMLYGWVMLDKRWMVMLVPLGGVAYILAWLGLAVAALKM